MIIDKKEAEVHQNNLTFLMLEKYFGWKGREGWDSE